MTRGRHAWGLMPGVQAAPAPEVPPQTPRPFPAALPAPPRPAATARPGAAEHGRHLAARGGRSRPSAQNGGRPPGEGGQGAGVFRDNERPRVLGQRGAGTGAFKVSSALAVDANLRRQTNINLYFSPDQKNREILDSTTIPVFD